MTASTPTAAEKLLSRMLRKSMTRPPSAHSLGLAKDALRPYQQDQDQDDQRAHVLQLDRDPQGGHLDEDAHDQAADEGAVGRAEATEGDAGEHEQQQAEAHLEADLLRDAEHH